MDFRRLVTRCNAIAALYNGDIVISSEFGELEDERHFYHIGYMCKSPYRPTLRQLEWLDMKTNELGHLLLVATHIYQCLYPWLKELMSVHAASSSFAIRVYTLHRSNRSLVRLEPTLVEVVALPHREVIAIPGRNVHDMALDALEDDGVAGGGDREDSESEEPRSSKTSSADEAMPPSVADASDGGGLVDDPHQTESDGTDDAASPVNEMSPDCVGPDSSSATDSAESDASSVSTAFGVDFGVDAPDVVAPPVVADGEEEEAGLVALCVTPYGNLKLYANGNFLGVCSLHGVGCQKKRTRFESALTKSGNPQRPAQGRPLGTIYAWMQLAHGHFSRNILTE